MPMYYKPIANITQNKELEGDRAGDSLYSYSKILLRAIEQ